MIKQIAKFGVVGIINTIIDFVLLNLLVAVVGWPILWANTISFSAAVTNSYFINKYWTFRNHEPAHLRQFSTFVLISIVGLVLSNLLVHYGTQLLGDYDFGLTFVWQYNIAKAVSAVIVLAWNFLASKYLVFHEKQS